MKVGIGYENSSNAYDAGKKVVSSAMEKGSAPAGAAILSSPEISCRSAWADGLDRNEEAAGRSIGLEIALSPNDHLFFNSRIQFNYETPATGFLIFFGPVVLGSAVK